MGLRTKFDSLEQSGLMSLKSTRVLHPDSGVGCLRLGCLWGWGQGQSSNSSSHDAPRHDLFKEFWPSFNLLTDLETADQRRAPHHGCMAFQDW
jgi:hypothetical protein